MMETRTRAIRVSLFGTFEILDPQKNSSKDTTPKLQQLLLGYLVMNRERSVAPEELLRVLYAEEEEEMHDPLASLRGLIFRMRGQLKKRWGEQGASFVVTEGGAYRWNPHLDAELDVESFDELLRRAEQSRDTEEQIECLKGALDVYRGRFLERVEGHEWADQLRMTYSDRYLEASGKLLKLLQEDRRFEKMLEVSEELLKKDPLVEKFYVGKLEALMELGDFQQAQDVYRRGVSMILDHLGEHSLQELEQAHAELMKRISTGKDSIAEAVRRLKEEDNPGAFLCDYGVFREIHQLEVRRAQRIGVSVYLALLTMELNLPERIKDEAYRRKVLADGMHLLESVIRGSLRAGDVLTRSSDSQYLVLLPTDQYETAILALRRVEKSFDELLPVRNVILQYTVCPVDGKTE